CSGQLAYIISVPPGVSASFSARWSWSGPPATRPTARTDACNMIVSPAATPSARNPLASSPREYTAAGLYGRLREPAGGRPPRASFYEAGNRGLSRLASGTGNGNPSLTERPRTRFCAWQFEVQLVAGGATSVASSPNTAPIRPPLATRHTDTPPQ